MATISDSSAKVRRNLSSSAPYSKQDGIKIGQGDLARIKKNQWETESSADYPNLEFNIESLDLQSQAIDGERKLKRVKRTSTAKDFLESNNAKDGLTEQKQDINAGDLKLNDFMLTGQKRVTEDFERGGYVDDTLTEQKYANNAGDFKKDGYVDDMLAGQKRATNGNHERNGYVDDMVTEQKRATDGDLKRNGYVDDMRTEQKLAITAEDDDMLKTLKRLALKEFAELRGRGKKFELEFETNQNLQTRDQEINPTYGDINFDNEYSVKSLKMPGGYYLKMSMEGVLAEAVSLTHPQNVVFMGKSVMVNNRVGTQDRTKLSTEETYQVANDGSMWHTNLHVGKTMKSAQIQKFKREKAKLFSGGMVKENEEPPKKEETKTNGSYWFSNWL